MQIVIFDELQLQFLFKYGKGTGFGGKGDNNVHESRALKMHGLD